MQNLIGAAYVPNDLSWKENWGIQYAKPKVERLNPIILRVVIKSKQM